MLLVVLGGTMGIPYFVLGVSIFSFRLKFIGTGYLVIFKVLGTKSL